MNRNQLANLDIPESRQKAEVFSGIQIENTRRDRFKPKFDRTHLPTGGDILLESGELETLERKGVRGPIKGRS